MDSVIKKVKLPQRPISRIIFSPLQFSFFTCCPWRLHLISLNFICCFLIILANEEKMAFLTSPTRRMHLFSNRNHFLCTSRVKSLSWPKAECFYLTEMPVLLSNLKINGCTKFYVSFLPYVQGGLLSLWFTNESMYLSFLDSSYRTGRTEVLSAATKCKSPSLFFTFECSG